MRKMVIEAAALAALLLGAGMAWSQPATGQPPGPGPATPEPAAKSKLEDLLAQALKANPDLRLAAAKLSEAEAELNRARLLVVQKVATLQQAIEAQQAEVDGATGALQAALELIKRAAISKDELEPAKQRVIAAKAKLAQLQAEMNYVLGKQVADDGRSYRVTHFEFMRSDFFVPKPAAAPDGPTADKIRAALDKPFTIDCKEMPLDEVVKAFQDANPGLLFPGRLAGAGSKVTVHFDHVPFGAALEWLEDALPNHHIVVRDYGLVLAPAEQVPEHAVPLHDFWKGAKGEEKPKPGAATDDKKEQGTVQSVDDRTGLLKVSLGSDDGLTKGQNLQVYRYDAGGNQGTYLGVIQIVDLGATESVAKPLKVNDPVKVGDRVATSLLGR